ELLGVTKETIRRDLRDMELNNELVRTHGGAYITEGVENELDTYLRQIINIEEKEIIAQKCADLIQTGDYIFLDGSTTCWPIARLIMGRKLTVLTTSLEIANTLSASSTVKLHVIGGEFSASNMDFYGENTRQALCRYYVDKTFISCRNVDLVHGITDTSDIRAAVHRLALDQGKLKYLLVDHSKLNAVSFAHIAPLTDVSALVTDCELPPDWRKYLDEHHIKYY
ncbi:MAG: DeoR/GlpR family DNA-binding transcription regulator, partial [Clostridiales bacterium]|nr:DeoR/GlpR family DNA-binding transcription regulator [Clostridiales bacterium]